MAHHCLRISSKHSGLLVCLLVEMLLELGDSICNRPINTAFLETTQACKQAVNHDRLLCLHLLNLLVLFGLADHEPVNGEDRTEDDDERRENRSDRAYDGWADRQWQHLPSPIS